MEVFFTWFEEHPGTASWFQAFGVILTLMGTAWVALAQNRAQRNLMAQTQQQQSEQRLQKLISLGEHALGLLRDGDSHFRTGNLEDRFFYTVGIYQRSAIEAVERAFTVFPYLDLPGSQTLSTALNLSDTFTVASGRLAEAVEYCTAECDEFELACRAISEIHLPAMEGYLQDLREAQGTTAM